MSEDKLQSDIARRFSELYPEKRGQLFHVPNERNNSLQAMRARAIGIFPGVADFIYFDTDKRVATELKTPGSRHKRTHIIQQLQWGQIWEENGGVWRLCRTTEEAIKCYNGCLNSGLTINQVREMLQESKLKNIVF